ncbi:MAG: hypothetical protein ACRD5G_03470 [Candidatus Acidiferrales bacterium]
MTQTGIPRSRGQKIFRIGMWWQVIGCGPLYLIILLSWIGVVDRDVNPVGPGILAFFSFIPSIITMIVGGVMMAREKRAQ